MVTPSALRLDPFDRPQPWDLVFGEFGLSPFGASRFFGLSSLCSASRFFTSWGFRFIVLGMGIFFSLLFSSHVFAATIVTQTVGQVGEYVLTSREVQISSVAENVLYPIKNSKGIYEIRPGSPEFNGAVTNALLETVVAFEAENFNVANITPDDLKLALATVQKAVVGKAYWAELEVSEAELQKVLSRKLTSKAFLKFKTNSMSGIITDQEAQMYYEKNRVKFGSLPFSSFKDNIKTYLAQQQLEERIRSWFEVIMRKYKVRNYTN